ncbi:MAG TPA: ABC transporter ATP-binding protein [Desulfobacterales bacterium]|nr:ABC transporter ATP-binding protein [Desulfobacterales bacterium]
MLNIQNLKCYHGRIQAIKGVDLFIGKGELVTLVGANGSGKSTLVQAVCGLLNEWKGEIRFENELLAGLKPSSIVKRGISMVPEGRMIFSTLSVLDNLKLGAYTRYRKKRMAEAVENDLQMVLDLFPVLKDRASQPAGTLSGGEQQMLAIGRALMARPKLLVLDEPSVGLAPLLVRKILSTLEQLRNQGLTILLIEQNAHAALEIADRGYVIETGRVVLEGAASDLLNDEELKKVYLGKDYSESYPKNFIPLRCCN